jgi:YMGG-like Gly-zipper
MSDQLTEAHYDWAARFCGIPNLAGPPDGSSEPDFDPPPPVGVASQVAPDAPVPASPLPPTPAEQAWINADSKLKQVDKQITALEVLGAPKAADCRKTLDGIKADAAAGHQEDAVKALDKLAPVVKAAFDTQRSPPTPTAEQLKARKEEAKKVTATAGHGTDADAGLVVDQLAKMPKVLLDALDKNGTKVKVCRGSVTDYLTELKGVKPRGWPAGSTWDSVPGLQQPDKKEVVIATVGHDKGDAHVPKTGEGHGSVNLVIHETAHGVDYASSPHVSAGEPFNTARNPDKGALDAYESQPGTAGQEETFAESCARFYSNDPWGAENTPHLHKYWRDNPLGPPDPPPPPEKHAGRDAAIGAVAGAAVGAAVGGPVGAAVGAGVGALVGLVEGENP